MSERDWRTVEIDVENGIEPARSRHTGRRSAVAITPHCVVVGTATGSVIAYDRSTLQQRWRAHTPHGGGAVSMTPLSQAIIVGERGPAGGIGAYDLRDGTLCWQYATATDVGEPQKQTRFLLPYVADLAVDHDRDRLYAVARRYERDGDQRSFSSAVYAFDADGTVGWIHKTDASPISVDAHDRRVAIAYNRCPGEHHHGLVVLDAEDGTQRRRWDPLGDGQRRVGDLSLVEGGIVLTSHADYRGYRLGPDGVEWCVDLATPRTIDGETVYAYPNHVHATDDGVVFVTGNSYPTNGRETDVLHPNEHAIFGVTTDGTHDWSASIGGFASELATSASTVAVPGAQQFRTRDPSVHGLDVFGVETGAKTSYRTSGIVTAAALDDTIVAAIEEPVVYHDEGKRRGAHRLVVGSGVVD